MSKIQRYFLEIKAIDKKVLNSDLNNNFKKNISLEKKRDFSINRFFYKEIGRDHFWRDRLIWTEREWIKYVSNKNVKTFVLMNKKDLVGFFELIIHPDKKEVEIAYFGILEEYQNKKLGSFLLADAIKKSFEENVNRVWLHTCSLDHKNALNNYLARGMKIFKSEIVNI